MRRRDNTAMPPIQDQAPELMRAAAKAPMQAPLQDYQRGTAFSLEVSMPKCKQLTWTVSWTLITHAHMRT